MPVAAMPLVRCVGRADHAGETWAELVSPNASLLRDSKGRGTAAVESDLRIASSLYFYVGWAEPRYGPLVLYYGQRWSESRPGWATPFDTGSLRLGGFAAPGASAAGTPGAVSEALLQEMRSYLDRCRQSLPTWRQRFSDYVDDYFESMDDYISGAGPFRDEDSGRFAARSQNRCAWNWELQIECDHPLFEGIRRVFMSRDKLDQITTELDKLVSFPKHQALWHELLDRSGAARFPSISYEDARFAQTASAVVRKLSESNDE